METLEQAVKILQEEFESVEAKKAETKPLLKKNLADDKKDQSISQWMFFLFPGSISMVVTK